MRTPLLALLSLLLLTCDQPELPTGIQPVSEPGFWTLPDTVRLSRLGEVYGRDETARFVWGNPATEDAEWLDANGYAPDRIEYSADMTAMLDTIEVNTSVSGRPLVMGWAYYVRSGQ